MKLFIAIVLATSSALVAYAGLRGQDPLDVDSSVYHLKLNNDKVRVFVVTFKPGQSIGVHKHPDHVVHALKGGKLWIHEVGKDPVTMDVPDGATVFLPAQSHSAKNVGKTNMRLLVTEIK